VTGWAGVGCLLLTGPLPFPDGFPSHFPSPTGTKTVLLLLLAGLLPFPDWYKTVLLNTLARMPKLQQLTLVGMAPVMAAAVLYARAALMCCRSLGMG